MANDIRFKIEINFSKLYFGEFFFVTVETRMLRQVSGIGPWTYTPITVVKRSFPKTYVKF